MLKNNTKPNQFSFIKVFNGEVMAFAALSKSKASAKHIFDIDRVIAKIMELVMIDFLDIYRNKLS